MICCLNPECDRPLNKTENKFCQNCASRLKFRLRNRYQPIKPLGKGGFGKTYLAKDLDRLDRLCVIKQLTFASERTVVFNKAKKLFELEAEQLENLGDNPQIPRLLAYFEEDGFLYLVQEFVAGENLLEKLEREGNFSEEQVLALLLDLLPVLDFVHSHNVIHRDLKPGNIMCRAEDGKHVLIDFGVSKVVIPDGNVATGTILGSQGFSPPEQIVRGKSFPASDLYSLGATCFYLLSGTSPFDLWVDRGYSWLENWQRSLKINLNPPLSFVLEKLLQKDVDLRYQTAAEVIKDLEKYSTVTKNKDLPVTRLHQTTLLPVNFKYLVPIALFSTGVLAIGMYSFYELSYLRSQHNNNALKKGDPLSPTTFKKIAIEPLEKMQIDTATDIWSLAVSPDGKRIASGNDDGNIYLYDRENGKEENVLEGHENVVRSIVFNPKNNSLISGDGDGSIKVWNLQNNKLEKNLFGHSGSIWSLAISPDGKTLISSSKDKTIKVWNLTTGEKNGIIFSHDAIVYAVAFSSDGKIFASGGADREIKIWNAKDMRRLKTLEGHQDDVRSIAITPDGKYLISGSGDKTVKIWELPSGQLVRTLEGHENRVITVAVSNDSEFVFSGSTDNSIKVWRVADGLLIDTLDRHKDWVLALASSLREDLLVSGGKDREIELWQYKYTN